MLRLLWVNGRFSWPVIGAIVFLTVSFVAVDFAWRVLVIPFAKLAAYAIGFDGITAALLICGYVFVFQKSRDTKRK